ncbi:oxidoreductase family protein [Mangrovimonas aestuarii]|uniref:oxidoreductase family protein n=1 Tax=Mangrovimonas aestuarii TaxID=3018443 RepID=UPI002379038E|nr:oxidoreductase family protein [Mangrovimonas aestuarii]
MLLLILRYLCGHMNEQFKSVILEKTGASSLIEKETIQNLWSGYGKIMRVGLENASEKSVIVKHVQLTVNKNHPRGWNTDIGHQRKVKSYKVETTWYDRYSKNSTARLPQCLAIETLEDEVLMVLEDLDEAGYSLRKQTLEWEEISTCLKWLAEFHASYLGKVPDGLWEVGTYWHLDTRPQELAILNDKRLKEAARAIDDKLNSCKYKTFVHGDAKLANFCFSEDGQVAGLDFQYVGGGCGMKDVAYFIGSCLNEKDCERLEAQILDTYFKYLQSELKERNGALETEWRSLYRVAWADFHRFIKGWSPDHWKINSYSERVTAEVINSL